MTPTPYTLPLRIRNAAEAFVVEDTGLVALACVYCIYNRFQVAITCRRVDP